MLIAQITDLHLMPEGRHWYGLAETNVSLRLTQVVEHLNFLDPLPDVVLLTGDAVDDVRAYAYLKELLAPLKMPYYVVPGNHDGREELRSAFRAASYMPEKGFIQYVVDDYPLRLIGLDSLVEGEHGGELCEKRLDWLENILQDRSKPALLFLHHPVIKVGKKLFDQIMCRPSERLVRLISSSPHILGILSGHYHDLCIGSFAGKVCYVAPSVAPLHVFAHEEDDSPSALRLESPAVTLHRWQEGSLISHVQRVRSGVHDLDWKEIQQNKLLSELPPE